jgi:hypothetical protein
MHWQFALRETLELVFDPLARAEVRWVLLGSAASALQGCPVTPRDLDFLAFDPVGVHYFAGLVKEYTPPVCDFPLDSVDWHSSQALPVSIGPDDYGFHWHFARWFVEGFRVEIAHIAAPKGFPGSTDGAGIWEAGPEIWPHVREVAFDDYVIPIVPLEIQLQTNLARGLQDRVEKIIAIFRREGYDHTLLRKSLSQEHQGVLGRLLEEQALILDSMTNGG